ncbi:MAG: formyltransferase family protein [Chloroflexia bacterium]
MRSGPLNTDCRSSNLTLRSPETLRRLTEYNAEVVVLAAYGLIVPRAGLEAVPLGWVNIHPSLLPRQGRVAGRRADTGGESDGSHTLQMTPGLDDGPVLAQEPVATTTRRDDGRVDRSPRPSRLRCCRPRSRPGGGARSSPAGRTTRATYAPKLTREESLLNWSDPAEVLARQVRAYNPWPAAYTWFSGERLRCYGLGPSPGRRPPGLVSRDGETGYPAVRCGEGTLLLLEVQGAGGNRWTGATTYVDGEHWRRRAGRSGRLGAEERQLILVH